MSTLTSKIITARKLTGIGNLYVEVWIIKPGQDAFLGSALTDQKGEFSINYDEKDLAPIPGSAGGQVYVKVFESDKLIKNTLEKPATIVRNRIPDITIVANEESDTVTRLVKGTIATPKGRGISNLVVRAYNKTTRNELFLSESRTDKKGAYLIYYTNITNKLTLRSGGEIDLVIKAYQTNDGNTPIITSPLIVNALAQEIINLSVGEGAYKGLDSYTFIQETLAASLPGTTLTALTDRDALLLANTHNLKVEDVSFYILAGQLALQWTALPPELYFGWFKLGLPHQIAALFNTPVEQLLTAIDNAIEENYIADTARKHKNGLEKTIAQWRTDNIINTKGERIERASIGGLLGISKLNIDQRKQLLDDWQNEKESIDDFWAKQQRSLGDDNYKDLELTLQLGSVTRNHLPLIQSIKTKKRIQHVRELASLKEEDWLQLLTEDKLEIPDDIPGDDLISKQKEFAFQLKGMTEVLIPTAVLAHEFKTDKEINSSVLDDFMSRNPDFEFRSQTVKDYLKEKPDALGDVADKIAVQHELEAMQRIFHLTPTKNKFKAAKILWQNKLHSAFAIKMGGLQPLKLMFDGDEEMAHRIFDTASKKHSRSQTLKMQLHSFYTPMYAVPSPGGIQGLVSQLGNDADLEALFGDQGYCKCKHCDSFFSPSAYLTDLFLYLNKVKVADGASNSVDTALEKLFKRRPDLGNIELSCENSHTPLPYIDLVNEVLEMAMSTIIYQVKEVSIFGKRFTLHVGNTPQTETDAATLKAHPQHIQQQPYNKMVSVGFPWTFPFNLWMLELRTYLNHLGISRADLMKSVLGKGSNEAEIACEYLNIIPEERLILNEKIDNTDVDLNHQFWSINDGGTGSATTEDQAFLTETGQGANAFSTAKYWSAGIDELTKLPVFLRQTGYSYETVSRLLKMRYLQPAQAIKFHPANSCLVSHAFIPGLTDALLSKIHKFGRILRKTNEDLNVLDRTIMAFGGRVNNIFLIHYANLLQLHKLVNVKDRKELLSWYTLLDREDYDGDLSLYTRLFMTPQKITEFRLNDDKSELKQTGLVIDPLAPPLNPDLLAHVLSASKLNSTDLELLINEEFPGKVITLNLAQISHIYRTASFCRAMKLKMKDYLALKQLLGFSPISGLSDKANPSKTLSFINKYQIIKEAGLDAEILDYILRHKSRNDAPFVMTDEEAGKILKQLHATINVQLKEVFPAGTTTSEVVENKLKQITGSNTPESIEQVNTTQQIIAGNSPLSLQEQETVIENKMAFFPNKQEAKTQLLSGALTDKEARLQYALKAINNYLLNNTIVQQLSTELSLPPHITEPLLHKLIHHPSINQKRAIDVFVDEAFVNANPLTVWTMVEQKDAFTILIKLHKIATLTEQLKLGLSQVAYLMTPDATANELPDMNALPVSAIETVSDIDKWMSLLNLVVVNKEFFKEGYSVFNILQSTNSNITKDVFFRELSTATGRKQDDWLYLSGAEGLNLKFPQDYKNGQWLIRITETLRLIDRAGVTAPQMAAWASPNIEKAQADSVRHAAMAKYGEKQWQEIAVPLRHNIREAQRDALVQYVLHYIKKHSGASFKDIDDIYEYYLIDTQMAACTDTSRTVLAASSVQLFVQRIMMNLEPGLTLPEKFMKEWKWRKYYRVWEANRKVFMWPENWIEPELRDDKTPFFKELENDLMQGELSTENIEKSYVNYLEKLHSVAHMKVVGMYQDDDTFHVIAHTPGTPAQYYYRRWENNVEWTAWEKIELDIFNGEEMDAKDKGILITPVVHNRRLFLFWPIFKIKKEPPTPHEEGEIENKKQKIDTENASIRYNEQQIKKLSQKIDSLKKTYDSIEYIQKMLAIEGKDWSNTLTTITSEIESTETLVSFHEASIDGIKSTIRLIEEDIRKLEQGHMRYQISMAWSQLRDGYWTPKKISESFIETPLFMGDFANGIAQRYYSIVPTEKNDGSIVFHIWHINKEQENNDNPDSWSLSEYSTLLSNYFKYDDCKSDIQVVSKHYNQSEKLHYPLIFMRSFIQSKSFQITNRFNTEITLLEKNNFFAKQIKSFQEGLRKTQHAFFYDDLEHCFFVSPPSFNLVAKRNASSAKSIILNSDTNALQGKVYHRIGNSISDNGLQNVTVSAPSNSNERGSSFYDASQSGQIIVRNKNRQPLNAQFNNNSRGKFSIIESASTFNETIVNTQTKIDTNGYHFYPFYHPYTCLFLKQLNRFGIEGLLSPDALTPEGKELLYQATPSQKKNAYFAERYKPNHSKTVWYNMVEQIDFTHGHAYATYNWEVFYHIPLFIATRLMQDQRFDEAQKWFHYIFDPTETQGEIPYRFWKIKPFHTYTIEAIKKDLEAVMEGGEAVKKQIKAWEEDPFNPHLLARFRKLAYMKTVVMKYLDNLIAWGDQLFRMDSIESMNEATQLYVLAAQILGKLPVETEAKPRKSKSFNELIENLTEMGNAWVNIENNLTEEYEDDAIAFGFARTTNPFHKKNKLAKLKNKNLKVSESAPTISILDDILYFCMSPNEKLLSYWDTVADRLFKIRNCMNIEGIVRSVPLFQPPIDPALLVKAAAAGIDISSAINDLYAPMPYYRFQVLIQKAQEFCQEVKSLGGLLLSALEKKDAEQISLIRSQHEIQMLESIKDIRKMQVEDARLAIHSLEESYKLAQIRYNDYSGRDFISAGEISAMVLSAGATVMQAISAVISAGGAVAAQTPGVKISAHAQSMASGSSTGTDVPGSGANNSETAKNSSKVFDVLAIIGRDIANNVSTLAAYDRRMEDWELQAALADQEMKQINKQILGAMIRQDIASREKDNLDVQTEHAKQADAFMRNKYTNQELYAWMTGQISAIYFQTYKMAYDMAKQAEKAFRFELGIESSDYIRFGYWDNMRKGLLSGEKLYHDLKRLELAYLEKNKREYEITKHVSLAKLDPLALVRLRATGTCSFEIPEALYDMDHAGHYFRRLKTVSVSIPCIAGPYTSVSATLSLMNSRYRKNASAGASGYAEDHVNETRFIYSTGAIQSIATSNAQNDNGMFELNFRDERYLPFEGMGAIGLWKLELPSVIKQFDYTTIADVIMHVKYTSREGGSTLKSAANDSLRERLQVIKQDLEETGLQIAIDVKHDLPNEWHLLKQTGSVDLLIDKSRLPYMVQNAASITIEQVMFIAQVETNPDAVKININNAATDTELAPIPDLGLYKEVITDIQTDTKFTLKVPEQLNELQELMLLVKYSFT